MPKQRKYTYERQEAFRNACITGDIKLAQWLGQKFRDGTKLPMSTLQTGLLHALLNHHAHIVSWLWPQTKISLHVIRAVIKSGRTDLMRQAISEGFSSKYCFIYEAIWSKSESTLKAVLADMPRDENGKLKGISYQPNKTRKHFYPAEPITPTGLKVFHHPDVSLPLWCVQVNPRALSIVLPLIAEPPSEVELITACFSELHNFWNGRFENRAGNYIEDYIDALRHLFKTQVQTQELMIKCYESAQSHVFAPYLIKLLPEFVNHYGLEWGQVFAPRGKFNEHLFRCYQANYIDKDRAQAQRDMIRLAMAQHVPWQVILPTADAGHNLGETLAKIQVSKTAIPTTPGMRPAHAHAPEAYELLKYLLADGMPFQYLGLDRWFNPQEIEEFKLRLDREVLLHPPLPTAGLETVLDLV